MSRFWFVAPSESVAEKTKIWLIAIALAAAVFAG
jgi:hypothetical protein